MKHVVSFGKRQWAVGLTWRSYEERPTLAELRDDGVQLNADLAAVRITPQSRQAGFFASEVGQKTQKKLYSLASAIADAREQPWLGIFRIADNLWWYIAVREGQAILPTGDVIGDEATILAARANHESFSDWSYVKGDVDDLIGLINEQGKRLALAKVKSLKPVSMALPAATAAAALLCIGGGAWWWHDREVAQEQARAAALAAQQLRMQQQAAAISPLVRTPRPGEWLNQCESALLALPATEFGWSLTKMSCNAATATALWQRNDGATVAERPQGAVSQTGDAVTQIVPLGSLQNGPDNGAGLAASNLALFSLLQPVGVDAQVSAPITPPPLPGQTAPVPGVPPNPEEAVSFTVNFPPSSIPFDQVPGLRLDTVSIDADGNWLVSGEIYGR